MVFGVQGTDMKEVSGSDRETAFFVDLWAVDVGNPKPKDDCPPSVEQAMTIGCTTQYFDDEETIGVWFSPVPGQERVIAVQRKKTFHKKAGTPMAALKGGVFSKYPKDQVSCEKQDAYWYTADWQFDAKNRIKRKCSSGNRGDFPSTVYLGDGIGLSIIFNSNNINTGLADNMAITLFNGDALYKSIGQTQATYKALKARADAKGIDKASKGQSQTKF